MSDPFTICSYYTYDTPYADVAHEYIIPSTVRLGLKTDIKGVFNLGSWQKNTSYKSKFVERMLETHKTNIVFLDCDAEVLQYPSLFENIPPEYNFAVHILDRPSWYGVEYGKDNSKELLSGTLWVRNTGDSKAIVREWVMTCDMFPQVWEQVILAKRLKDRGVNVYELPISYCYIKTLPDGRDPLVKCESPVVVHHQVSRQFRNKIKS